MDVVSPSRRVATFQERCNLDLLRANGTFFELDGLVEEFVHLVVKLAFVSRVEGIVGNLIVGNAEFCLSFHFGINLGEVHCYVVSLDSLVELAYGTVELTSIDVVVAALCQVEQLAFDVGFVARFAFCDLGVLELALQGIGHFLQV